MNADELWAIAYPELMDTLPRRMAAYLAGARLEGVYPHYRVVITANNARGLGWLVAQAGPAIRRKLSTLLGHPVTVEIVCQEKEKV